MVPEILEPVTVLVQAKAPVELVKVQPVDPDPPPKRILPVPVLLRFRAPAPLASILRASSVPDEIAERAMPAAAAALLILRPVADDAVDASI